MALAVMVAACTAAPTPTPTVEPTPSPTPVDIVEAFADALLDPGFTADAVISGSITGAGQEGTISGSAEFAGQDSHQRLAIVFAGVESETEVISANGEQYARTADGPWVHQPPAVANATLQSQFLEILADLEDEGVEQVDGQTLHHLVRATPVDLSAEAFGLTDATITDFVGSVDFYAMPGGTPAILRFTLGWNQAGTAIEMDMQYSLDLDATPTIARPDDVWTSFSSDRFAYTMAYPELWVLDEVDNGTEAFDLFYTLPSTPGRPGEIQVYFYPGITGVLNAADFFAEAIPSVAEVFGVEVESFEPITVGSLEGRYVGLLGSDDDGPGFHQYVLLFGGDRAWSIDWYSQAGNEANDRARFELALDTFQPVVPPPTASNVWGLQVGECFSSLPLFVPAGQSALFVGGVDLFSAVECADWHTGEVIAVLSTDGAESCEAMFEEYVGRPLAGSIYGLLEMTPVPADHAPQEIGSLCVVHDPPGSSTGSAAGSQS